jgi:hypothetical protein
MLTKLTWKLNLTSISSSFLVCATTLSGAQIVAYGVDGWLQIYRKECRRKRSRPNLRFFFSLQRLFQPIQGPWPLIQFRNHFSRTVGLLGRVINPSQGLYLNTGQHKHRIYAYTHQTSTPSLGFQPTIPASVRVKAVHALDRAAIVTGQFDYGKPQKPKSW